MGVRDEMKIKKSILAICGLALVACGALLWGGNVMSQGNANDLEHQEVRRVSMADIGAYAPSIRTSVLRLAILNGLENTDALKFEIIKKIDFSKPGDIDYGDMPTWEIYNPQGGRANLNYPDPKIIKEHADSDGFIISAANKVHNSATSQADLMAVLPFFKKESCEKVISQIKMAQVNSSDIPKIANPPLLTFDSGANGIVELPYIDGPGQSKETPYGCVEANGSYYYYHVIYAF